MLQKFGFFNKDIVNTTSLNTTNTIDHVNDDELKSECLNLFDAMNHGSIKDVMYFLNAIANVNTADDDKKTPLHIVTKFFPEVEAVKMLINAGADVNVRDDEGCTPLHNAVFGGEKAVEIVKLLIDAGSDVNARDNKGRTVLHYIAHNYSEVKGEVVKMLVRAGANVNARDNESNTPLHLASSFEIAKVLLMAGANVEVKNKYGYTPMVCALGNRDSPNIVDMLLKAGDDPEINVKLEVDDNDFVDVPLICFAVDNVNNGYHGPEFVEVILNAGANVNVRDKYGNTPLMWAVRGNKPSVEVIRMLIASGADIDAKNNKGDAPLLEAILYDIPLEIAKTLIEFGANVDATVNVPIGENKYSEEPLICVLLKNHPSDEIIKKPPMILRPVGSAPNSYVKRKLSPFFRKNTKYVRKTLESNLYRHSIGEGPYEELARRVKILIDADVNVNVRDSKGVTPLIHAICSHKPSIEVIKLLIDAGADVNARDNKNIPPLVYAICRPIPSVEIVELLIAAGADVNYGIDYDTPLCLAMLNHDALTEIIGILRQAGAHK